MTKPAIQVEGISKLYHIGHLRGGRRSVGRAILDGVTAPFKRTFGLLTGHAAASSELDEKLWALKDVSFDVKPGEVLGILGRNGAGKSTLLKIISRIVEPTEGRITVCGRIGSLLEVGTGFHPDLTGRENVYLNGAMLGMKRDEIQRKFDEIIDFSEVAKFIDTPVKHYSSGMYTRLAFSVAAHLEPEILIVDEVLAVGDIAFQKKCIDKMESVAHSGKTILFVSHSMYNVQRICTRALWLNNGIVEQIGGVNPVVAAFQQFSSLQKQTTTEVRDYDSPDLKILQVLVNGKEETQPQIHGTADLRVEMELQVLRDVTCGIGVSVTSGEGIYVCGIGSYQENRLYRLKPGRYRAGAVFPKLTLRSGAYFLQCGILDQRGTGNFANRARAATLLVTTPFTFDGLIGLDHQWIDPVAPVAGRVDSAEEPASFVRQGT